MIVYRCGMYDPPMTNIRVTSLRACAILYPSYGKLKSVNTHLLQYVARLSDRYFS